MRLGEDEGCELLLPGGERAEGIAVQSESWRGVGRVQGRVWGVGMGWGMRVALWQIPEFPIVKGSGNREEVAVVLHGGAGHVGSWRGAERCESCPLLEGRYRWRWQRHAWS
mgnify:CR=1 FL=1